MIPILRDNSEAIGWSLSDIKGIDPSRCTHRIDLEEGTKPVRQPQRRLNPVLQDVVKKEIIKLLDSDMIYPVPDSKWVNPIHVVPKKSGIIVEKNDKGELDHMCIHWVAHVH